MEGTISFHGAAGTVTGSRHLLSLDGRDILVDAGMFQGLKELRKRNWAEPTFSAKRLERLLLTHAHIDHSGYIPRLVKEGFSAPIHATPGTADLANILLVDAARIQEEDADYANRRGFSKHRPALPLYTEDDAHKALDLMRPIPYGAWLDLGGGVRASYRNAGHILGSAMIEIRLDAGRGEKTIVFSGDVGRYSTPLETDPKPLPRCDALVLESTYGDRLHDRTPMLDQLRKDLLKAFDRKGTVLVPAFAVGRAQLVTLILTEAMSEGKLPEVPIHIDSPMAVNATRVYTRHMRAGELDPDLVAEGRNRLFPEHVRFHRTVAESKELNDLPGPRVIISSSGMLTGGRVLHHLARLLPDERNLLVLVGYQAAGTRGRKLMQGAKTVRMHGRDIPVAARFICVHGLSAHADRDGLVRLVKTAPEPPRTIFLTHGEPDAAQALAEALAREVSTTVHIPKMEESFDLASAMERG